MENKKDYLVPINDVTGISWRLKEIDVNYRLYFNNKSRRVEVHNMKNIGDTLAVVCPYEKIDTRLLTLVRQTRRERSAEIIKEIEEENQKIEKSKIEKVTDDAKQKLKELLKTKLSKEV